ncbi:MAG: hypothetical protein ACJ8J0_05830 [Longimicrobiaceae bacterium]
MRPLLWSLPPLLLACTLQAQPRSQLPDPVEFPENRWVDLGRVDDDTLAADREALSAPRRERGVWVRLHGPAGPNSPAGLFIYDYYIIDCEGGRSRYHVRLYVFDRIVHNTTGMTSEWEPIEPGSVPSRLCKFKT